MDGHSSLAMMERLDGPGCAFHDGRAFGALISSNTQRVRVVSIAVSDVSDSAVDAFVDALWLEDGLSRNTLQAYRRDLTLFAQWLAGLGKVLNSATEADLSAYFGARHAETKATTANRRLTVFKRYFVGLCASIG